jgi:hypothetical protein
MVEKTPDRNLSHLERKSQKEVDVYGSECLERELSAQDCEGCGHQFPSCGHSTLMDSTNSRWKILLKIESVLTIYSFGLPVLIS